MPHWDRHGARWLWETVEGSEYSINTGIYRVFTIPTVYTGIYPSRFVHTGYLSTHNPYAEISTMSPVHDLALIATLDSALGLPPKPSNAQRALIDTGAQASDTRLRRVGLRREPSGAPGEPSGFIGYSGAVMKNRGVYTTPVKSASFKLEIKSDNEASVKGSPPILS